MSLQPIKSRVLADFSQVLRVLSVSPAVLYTLDSSVPQPRSLWVSENIYRMTGFTQEEALEPGWWITNVHPDDAPKNPNPIDIVRARGRVVQEYRFRCKDGHWIWVRDELVALPSEESVGDLLTGSWVEITEQKAMEEALKKAHLESQAASRAKSVFLSTVSHELRTPMNGILGMTELALDTALTDEQRSYLEAVKTSADRLMRVLVDILDFSRIEAGQVEMESTPFCLRDVLSEVLGSQCLAARCKGLVLNVTVEAGVPEIVVGDRTCLRQVLTHLIDNAVKFTDKGEVAVRIERDTQVAHLVALRFAIRDTGIGIAEDRRKHIFEAFTQADGSTTRRHGGSGLGLTISTSLVKRMGGCLWLESEVGKGSTFHFTALFLMAEERKDG